MVDNNGRKSLMKKEVKREVVKGSVEASLNVIEIQYHMALLVSARRYGL